MFGTFSFGTLTFRFRDTYLRTFSSFGTPEFHSVSGHLPFDFGTPTLHLEFQDTYLADRLDIGCGLRPCFYVCSSISSMMWTSVLIIAYVCLAFESSLFSLSLYKEQNGRLCIQ